MENKNTGLIITIVVLSLILGILGGYVIIDKLVDKPDVNEQSGNNNQNNSNNSGENNNQTNGEQNNNVQNNNTNVNSNKTVTYKGVEFIFTKLEKDIDNAPITTSDEEVINVVLEIKNKSNKVFDEWIMWEWVNSQGKSTYDGNFPYPHELSINGNMETINPGESITAIIHVLKPKNENIVKIKAIGTFDGQTELFEIDIDNK